MLWPIHFTSIPFSTPDTQPLEPPEFGKELAEVALVGFEKYITKMLPEELKVDTDFADEFRVMDHSRINVAFRRWQQRAFADHFAVPVDDLTIRGERAPRLDGLSYRWPELYENPKFKRLQGWSLELARKYLARSGFQPLPENLTAFVWVEVFKHGDAMSPRSRTSTSYMMGRYFATANRGSLKMNFEDPRGINPPYGKTYSHAPFQGNMVLFPAWVSCFITPNMFKDPAVSFTFLVYSAGGGPPSADETARIKLEAPGPAPLPRRPATVRQR